MNVKLLLITVTVLLMASDMVQAEFNFNNIAPAVDQLGQFNMICVPRRTVIKIGQENDQVLTKQTDEDDGDFHDDIRRSHMNAGQIKGEKCKICVCSVDGKQEYCSRRPARNVNECTRMASLMDQINENEPYGHERTLAYRIRRDYLWHNDEIPYKPNERCARGTSYYSNNANANETDIDVSDDIDSLLQYPNNDICFYCVCSVGGEVAKCITREPWYCQYYRLINPESVRDEYTKMMGQDRPAYFRQLSYRLRRTMDTGATSLINMVGDINKNSCIPFVSEYSDCTDANMCSGCQRCNCLLNGTWSCKSIFRCPMNEDEEDGLEDANSYGNALDVLYSQLQKEQRSEKRPNVPPPHRDDEDRLLDDLKQETFESFMSRQKRSVNVHVNNTNDTVKFFNAVDDLNEDTLKNSNSSGTIHTNKVVLEIVPKISRRTIVLDNHNKSSPTSLHINYNQPTEDDHHITENKIDPQSHSENILGKNIINVLGDYSQNTKNKDISKLVVNELKSGIEIIGDKKFTSMSNITFTPENDTLTAMAFIAGNLLNKLWNMEKDSSDRSVEIDTMKHEKINDLLDLFKEPLSLRQETFLKSALEKLSNTLHENKNAKNISLCETFVHSDPATEDKSRERDPLRKDFDSTKCTTYKDSKNDSTKPTNIDTEVVSKLNSVLNLIKKYDNVQRSLDIIKERTDTFDTKETFTNEENYSLNLFGGILEKISKLLLPYKNKRISNKIKKFNKFSDPLKARQTLFNKIKFDIGNVNITTKDKLVLDYINHIENNPGCLFRKNLQPPSSDLSIDFKGEILSNLSEFLKVKSLYDLVRLISPKPQINFITSETTTITTTLDITTKSSFSNSDTEQNNLKIAKERLKNHLKAIIDDLVELQHGSGPNNNFKGINVADAVPCLYNLLHNNNSVNYYDASNKFESTSLEQMKYVIDSLKNGFKTNSQYRRMNVMSVNTNVKSAKVWERVIKNIKRMLKNTRRNFNENTPKTQEQIENMIKHINTLSDSYKNNILLTKVPIPDQLKLLKTLEADVKQHANVLKNIKMFNHVLSKLPLDKQILFKEFIDNSKRSVELSAKVLSKMSKNSNETPITHFARKENINRNQKESVEHKQDLKLPNLVLGDLSNKNNGNMRFTRGQLLKQLMINKIQQYLKHKDEEKSESMTFKIAENILYLIKNGNEKLAVELFKTFILNKEKSTLPIKLLFNVPQEQEKDVSPVKSHLKEPLFQFEGFRDEALENQDNLLKQIINLKYLNS